MALHVIVGKGPVGTNVAQQLAAAGHDVRIVSRSGGVSAGRIQHVAADATDAAALTRLTEGAVALYNCANPAYDKWATDWPPLAAAMVAAVESTGAVYAITGNVYAYGSGAGVMTEDSPLAATDVKGRVRAQMWLDAKAMHDAGRIRAVEVRGADFYGPIVSQGHFADRAMPKLLTGKPIQLLGNVDLPHSFTYVPDMARALIAAAADPTFWGRAWHAPTNRAGTQREMAEAVAEAAGTAPARVKQLPWVVLQAVGIAVPMLREVVKMRYQFDEAAVVNSARSEAAFGFGPTPRDIAVAETVAWWQSKLARSERQPVAAA